MNHVEIFKRFQRLQGGDQEVRYAKDLPANDPRWEAFAKALGVNVEELKKKNLPSKFDQDYENMAQDMLRRVKERGYGESRLLNEKQFDPNLVPIRAPYGRQRYYDPASALGVDPIMAQGGTEDVPPWLKAGYQPQEPGTVWVSPSGVKKVASAKDASGIYTPQEMSEADIARLNDDEQGHRGPEFAGSETPEQMLDRRRRTAYKTVGVNINGEEVEIPIWDEDMTPEQAEGFARDRLELGLSPFASDMELEAAQRNNAERLDAEENAKRLTPELYPPRQYALGTGNVGHHIFKRAQHLAEGTANLPYDPSYPGPTNPHESGSGYWTQRLVGTGVGTASNFFVPGLGLLTGPIASWALRAMQSGMSQNAVQNAVKAYQTSQTGSGQGGDTTTAPATDTSSNATAPTTNAPPSAGIGIDPFGNPADPGEFWSNDFGRWGEGDQYGTTPGNYNPSGPGGVAGTRGVWGGQTTIPIASDPNFTPSLGWAMPAASGGGAYGGNTMAKIALHSGTFRDAATPEQWAFMQNYLSGGGGGGGGGQGVGGAGRPMTQSVQMGTSSVNPGLKLFHAIQKRKKTT